MTVGLNELGLAAKGLKKSYKRRVVVDNVDINVKRGEAVGLLGPNGAGKTTSFSIITGLINADAGEVWLDHHNITGLPMYRRARMGIGYLPQETSIFRGLTVEKNIMAVLELVESDPDKREEKLEMLLDEFAIKHIRHSSALSLSGGERRRTEIARALATDPHFMLLDEPLAGIDPIAVAEIRELISHLKQRDIGVLITDHNVRDTLSIVDRAYIINQGCVLKEGTPEQIIKDKQVRKIYLGQEFKM